MKRKEKLRLMNSKVIKNYNVAAIAICVVVYILVGLMRSETKLDLGFDTTFLPGVIAIINTLVAICLLAALYFVKQKNITAHKQSINIAMILSALFLVCYVLYHFTNVETRYCYEGTKKTMYLIILLSHIVLAGISLPFILFTYIRGLTGQIEKHRKMAKWIYPVWLYVAISGPVVYLMLRPCYS